MPSPYRRILAGCAVAVIAGAAVGFISGYWTGHASIPVGWSNAIHENAGVNAAAVQNNKKPQTLGTPAISEEESYSAQHPSLMALTLSDKSSSMLDRYGKPGVSYEMNNDNDPLTVYEYSDFAVGIDRKETVRFIEVRTEHADPGLHGLKLGQSASRVVETLGKPDSDTGSVMTYRSKGSVLKLDLDPLTKLVLSIKLFGADH